MNLWCRGIWHAARDFSLCFFLVTGTSKYFLEGGRHCACGPIVYHWYLIIYVPLLAGLFEVCIAHWRSRFHLFSWYLGISILLKCSLALEGTQQNIISRLLKLGAASLYKLHRLFCQLSKHNSPSSVCYSPCVAGSQQSSISSTTTSHPSHMSSTFSTGIKSSSSFLTSSSSSPWWMSSSDSTAAESSCQTDSQDDKSSLSDSETSYYMLAP